MHRLEATDNQTRTSQLSQTQHSSISRQTYRKRRFNPCCEHPLPCIPARRRTRPWRYRTRGIIIQRRSSHQRRELTATHPAKSLYPARASRGHGIANAVLTAELDMRPSARRCSRDVRAVRPFFARRASSVEHAVTVDCTSDIRDARVRW